LTVHLTELIEMGHFISSITKGKELKYWRSDGDNFNNGVNNAYPASGGD